jgi:hypothetical protein
MRGSPDSARDGSVHASFERQHGSLLKNNLVAAQDIEIIRTTLIKIKQFVHTSPQTKGNLTFDRQSRGRKERRSQTL